MDSAADPPRELQTSTASPRCKDQLDRVSALKLSFIGILLYQYYLRNISIIYKEISTLYRVITTFDDQKF